MLRFLLPATLAVLLASAQAADAQVYHYSYLGGARPSAYNGPGSSFHWYGVPGGGLHTTLGSGASVYPYYNFGGYRSTYPAPLPGSYRNSAVYPAERWNGRRGWRR